LVLGSGPPAFTAMAISFPTRVNCFAIRSHLANIVDFLTSNMRPILVTGCWLLVTDFDSLYFLQKFAVSNLHIYNFEARSPQLAASFIRSQM
jgi:hypothetical protein